MAERDLGQPSSRRLFGAADFQRREVRDQPRPETGHLHAGKRPKIARDRFGQAGEATLNFMDSLVLSNIRQRPTRTLISMAGGGLGGVLVILNTGLVRGMLNDRIRREQGVGAEIQFLREGVKAMSPSSALPLDIRYADRLKQIPGVNMVSPIGHYFQSGNSGLGIELVDAIEL